MTDAALANPVSTAPVFCEDDELGYRRSLTDLTTPLTLDESYRLAHLPLVAPEHPGIIARREGKFYDMGRHPVVYSLVLPLEDEALRASPLSWRWRQS